jgi:sugar phosphate isomerase/epimerase
MTTPAFPPLPKPARPFPFRLGVTSYVYPDALLPNVRTLASVADDVELVFFESGNESNLPSPAEINELAAIAREHALSYTVHFPIDKALGSPSRDERLFVLDRMLRIIETCHPLNPHGWILHLEGINPSDSPDRVSEWQRDLRPLVARLWSAVDDPSLLCIENLGYPFEWCQPILALAPFAHCLDIGHLWQMNYDWQSHVRQYLPSTRIIHLYGTDNTTSRHHALTLSPAPQVQAFLSAIAGYTKVLTLETFGYEDTNASVELLIHLMESCPGGASLATPAQT